MIASSVLMSDAYCGLSYEGRDAYVTLCAFTNGGGLIDKPSFVLQGRGHDLELLDELRDAGFILTIQEESFITHFWLSNERRDRYTRITENTLAYQTHRLGFEGEPFKSKFVDLSQNTSPVLVPYQYITSTEEVQPNTTQYNATQHNPISMANGSLVQVPYYDDTDTGQVQDAQKVSCLTEQEERELTTLVNKCKVIGQYDEQEMRSWLIQQYELGGMDAVRTAAGNCLDAVNKNGSSLQEELQGDMSSWGDSIPF